MRQTARVLASFILLAGLLSAQETRHRQWDFEVWVGVATGQEERGSLIQAQTLTLGVYGGRPLTGEIPLGWFSGNLELGVNVVPVTVVSRPNGIFGGGFEPVVVRWNFRQRRRFVPYIELAGGSLVTNSNFPAGNTSSFNFSARGGGGVAVLSGAQRAWDVGLHYSHISNANLGDKNPEFNGVQLTVGYHWFW